MQKDVEKFNKNKNYCIKPMPVCARFLDIQSELGELCKEYLKASNYGTDDFKMSEDFKMEFGDVLYSLLSLACETNIDAKKCLNMALNKYLIRMQKNNNMGSINKKKNN